MDMYPQVSTGRGAEMALATQQSTLAAISAAIREQIRPASQSIAKPKEENHEAKSVDA